MQLDAVPRDAERCDVAAALEPMFAPEVRREPRVAALEAVLNAPVVPFASPPSDAGTVGEYRRLLRSSARPGSSEALFEALLSLVPEYEALPRRGYASSRAAEAARELQALANEHLPALSASVGLQAAGTARFGAGMADASALVGIRASHDAERRIARSLQAGGDDALVLYTAARLAARLADGSPSTAGRAPPDLDGLAADYQAARFLRTYFRAYFRSGKVVQSTLKVDEVASKAVEAVRHRVKVDPKEADALTEAFRDILMKACDEQGDSGCLLTALGQDRLVTRSGESLQFRGVALTLGDASRLQAMWDYPRSAEVAPQLVRVYFEALFDSMRGRVPAFGSATACTVKPPLFGESECLSAVPRRTASELAKKPVRTRYDVVASVDELASRADGYASVAAGQLIRGASIGALNNEAIARSVENLAGVFARKTVERVAWAQSGYGQCRVSEAAVSLQVRRR